MCMYVCMNVLYIMFLLHTYVCYTYMYYNVINCIFYIDITREVRKLKFILKLKKTMMMMIHSMYGRHKEKVEGL